MSLESKVKKVGSVARWAAPYKYVPFEDHLKIVRQSSVFVEKFLQSWSRNSDVAVEMAFSNKSYNCYGTFFAVT